MILKNNNTFHLQGRDTSYIMAVNSAGDLLHIHYGKKLRDRDYSDIQPHTSVWITAEADRWSLEANQQEYPAYGHIDLRSPAYSVNNTDGNNISRLKYKDYVIKENKVSEIKGMPSIFAGDKSAQTLEITLFDEVTMLEVVLSYTVFDEYNVILRNAVFTNKASGFMSIDTAYSACLDMNRKDCDLIYFPGGWAKERDMRRQPITMGIKTDISNARGGSGHYMNPFVMVADRNADENNGEVYGFSLIYSGNHSSMIDCDQYGNIRVLQGINPFQFMWTLDKGESFCTPQSVLCYSDNGIGGVSRELNNLYRFNLCRSKWTNKERPVLINNWEGTYFDFTEEKLIAIAAKAKEVGVELFVLDDGWFGKRVNDTSSLGDWFVNYDKLPSGIDGLAKKINDLGLKFGLWFEPEMVNPDSELYRTHPDWAIAVPGRDVALSRHQLVLDLSRDDVCEYVIDAVSKILSSANVEYVKWDMNRPIADMPFVGYNHEYTLGFYKVMDAITSAFPDVLFEGCSGGGGRFDAGVLAYMPQIWTSDNSDAVARLKIQYSTSMGYPVSSMSAHVTTAPNHQNGRLTSLKMRGDTAYAGIFGYELDITRMSDEEIEEVRKQIVRYKELRPLMLNGDFYRLLSPYDTNYCSWAMIAKDKSAAFVFISKILCVTNEKDLYIKLSGLDANADYLDEESGIVYGGDELMYKGYLPKFARHDFSSVIMRLKKI